jgi:glycosyltransferase involved in cell wall biosynthesis
MMKLGVDALRLSGQRLGIGRYLEYLLKYWNEQLERSDVVTLYVREPVNLDVLELSDAFRVKVLGPAINGTLWENAILAPRCAGQDVLFGPSYTLPLTYSGRSVVATHSVNEVQPDAHPWWYNYTYSVLHRLSALKADRVIVPSESTKADVEHYYGIGNSKIDVVAEGADEIFRPISDQEILRKTRERYFGYDRPYILFVGKLSQRRNIPSLIRAFAVLRERYNIPHGLLLFGPNVLHLPLAKLSSELGLTGSVVQTDGKVAGHEELLPIYNAAELYVYPSSYDGFSLTMVEAMACGLPVVTSKRAAIGEIANGYAEQVDDPSDPEALANAIGRVIRNQILRSRLRDKSLERAACFRLRETAQATLEVLRKAAAG